ncbi:MAG: helix-turn-helix domain-containing protein [candidate division WOR-3 bacterium]
MEENKDKNQILGWCLIPPYILSREDLSLSEKVLYGRILGLADKDGYCFASNAWLGKQINLSKTRVAHLISRLKELGLIKVEVIKDADGKILQRRIYPLLSEMTIPMSKIAIPIVGNDNRGIVKNSKYSNRDKSNREEYISSLYSLSPSNPRAIGTNPRALMDNPRANPKKLYSSLKDIKDQDLEEIAHKYRVSVAFVKLALEKMTNWLEAKGKRYKNYKRALMNWVLSEAQKFAERRYQDDRKRGIDASNLY